MKARLSAKNVWLSGLVLVGWLACGGMSLAIDIRLVSVDENGDALQGVESGSGQQGLMRSPVDNLGNVTFSLAKSLPVFPYALYFAPSRFQAQSGTSAPWYVSDFDLGHDAVRTFALAPTVNRLYFTFLRYPNGSPAASEFEATKDWQQAVDWRSGTGGSNIAAVDVSHDGWRGVFETLSGDVALRFLTADNQSSTLLASAVAGTSRDISISGNGERVAFASLNSSLPIGNPPDDNGMEDIVLYEVSTGEYSRVLAFGLEPSAPSSAPHLSFDGEVVVFQTQAGAFWGGNNSNRRQIVAVDLATGMAELCSRASVGVVVANDHSERPRISADARFVVFSSLAGNLTDDSVTGIKQVYVYDRQKSRTFLVSKNAAGEPADAACERPAFSPDGRYVTFVSEASNLSPLSTGANQHVFRVDLGPVVGDVRLSVLPGALASLPAPAVGRAVGNVDIWVGERPDSGELRTDDGTLVEPGVRYGLATFPWRYTAAEVSAGRTLHFDIHAEDAAASSLPATVEIRVVDPDIGYIERVSITSIGGEVNLPADGLAQVDLALASVAIDGQGSTVGFSTRAALTPADVDDGFLRNDVYSRDRDAGRTHWLSTETAANKPVGRLAVSGGGRWIVHHADHPDQGGIHLVRRLATGGETARIVSLPNVSNAFAPGVGVASSHTGEVVAFLADGQVMIWEAATGEIRAISHADDGSPANAACAEVALSADGRFVAFKSEADNLVAGMATGESLLYVGDLAARVAGENNGLFVGSLDETGTPVAASFPRLSGNGRFLVFLAGAPARLQVRDLFAETTSILSVGDGIGFPDISHDGRFTVFTREEAGVRQVYRHDRQAAAGEATILLSNDGMGGGGSADSGAPAISATGQFVAFPSLADNLVANDTGGVNMDVFVNDLGPVTNALPVPTLLETVAAVEDELRESVALTYADAEGDDVAVEIVSPPSHALIFEVVPAGPGRVFASFSYQGEANFCGDDSFSYRVGDAHGWSAPQVVSIHVEDVNDPPAWTGRPTFAGPIPEAEVVELDLRDYASDPDLFNPPPYDDERLIFQIAEASLAGGGSVVDWIEIVDGYRLMVSPPFDVASYDHPLVAFDVSLAVSDRGGATVPLSDPVRVEVENVDRPPFMISLEVSPPNARTTDNLVAVAVGGDPDEGDEAHLTFEYQWRWNGQPLAGLTAASLPAIETLKGEAWSVAVRAVSRGLTSDWLVSPPRTILNTPPSAQAGTASVDEQEAIVLDLAGLVQDPDAGDGVDVLVYTIVEPYPERGTYALVGSALTYWPNWPELREGDERQMTVHFRVDDGESAAESAVAMTIHGVNDPPVALVEAHVRLAEDEIESAITTGWRENPALGGSSGFGPGAIAVWDVDSSQADVDLKVVALPLQGDVLLGGSPLAVGDRFAIGEPLVYRTTGPGEGEDAFALVAVDEFDAESAVAEVKVFFARFSVPGIALVHGWNAVAFPLASLEADGGWPIADLLVGMGGQIVEPIAYSLRPNGAWAAAERVGAGEGFVVYCHAPDGGSIPVGLGIAVESVVALASGWHVRGGIGHQSEVFYVPQRVEGGDYGRGWLYGVDGAGGLSVPEEMRQGEAYWFRVATPGALDFSLNRPR